MRLINVMNLLNQNTQIKKKKKYWASENKEGPLKGRQKVLNHFEIKIFPIRKQEKGKGIKIPTPTQIPQILPIALVQVKAANTSENSLNEIQQIIYFLYQGK